MNKELLFQVLLISYIKWKVTVTTISIKEKKIEGVEYIQYSFPMYGSIQNEMNRNEQMHKFICLFYAKC